MILYGIPKVGDGPYHLDTTRAFKERLAKGASATEPHIGVDNWRILLRNSDNFAWSQGNTLLMLDYDPPNHVTPWDAQGFQEALLAVVPELQGITSPPSPHI